MWRENILWQFFLRYGNIPEAIKQTKYMFKLLGQGFLGQINITEYEEAENESVWFSKCIWYLWLCFICVLKQKDR